MKTLCKWAAGFAGMALITGTVFAQTSDSDQQGSQNTTGGGSTWADQSSSANQSAPSRSYENQQPGNQSSSTGGSSGWGAQSWSGNPSDQNQSQSYGSEQPGSQSYGNESSWGQQNSGQQGWNRGSNQGYGTTQEQGQSGRFYDALRLSGQEVNDQQGRTLGQIKDIAFNTQNGQVFAVVGLGNGQNALVPVQALRITGAPTNPQVSLNATRQDLRNGPVVQNNRWIQSLDRPGFTQRIYNHYGLQVQPGSELGVVILQAAPQGATGGGGNLGGSSTGQNSSSNLYGNSGNASAAGNRNFFPQQGNGAYQQQYGVGSIQK